MQRVSRGQILRGRRLVSEFVVQSRINLIPQAANELRVMRLEGTIRCPGTADDVGLLVPSGVKNLRLEMDRWSSVRQLTATLARTRTIQVGPNPIEPTTTGFSCPSGASAGVTTITVNKNGSEVPAVGTFYFLYDRNKWETHASTAEERLVGGELVKVKSVTAGATTATVEFENALSQPFASSSGGIGNVLLSKLPSVGGNEIGVCENITLKGFRVFGISNSSNYASWMWVLWSSGVTVLDFYGCESVDTGISFIRCRNVQLFNARGENVENASNVNEYSFQFQRCAGIEVNRAFACNARYCVVMEAGSSGFKVTYAYGVNILESVFDIHGGDAYGGEVRFVSAFVGPPGSFLGSIALGNTAWRRGASNITVEDCSCQWLNLRTAIRNSTVRRVTCTRVNFLARENSPVLDKGAAGAYPDSVTMENLTVTYNGGSGTQDSTMVSRVYCIANVFKNILVKNSTIESVNNFAPAFGCDLTTSPLTPQTPPSDITFEGCTFKMSDTTALPAFRLVRDYVNTQKIKVTLKGACVINIPVTTFVGSTGAIVSTEVEVVNDTTSGQNVRKPSPDDPNNKNSARNLQASDFDRLKFTVI